MKIRDILAKGEPTLSFEVFPPKTTEVYESVKSAVSDIVRLGPDFMSVTYGAGGGTSAYTVEMASLVKDAGVASTAHLTCVSSSKETVRAQIEKLKAQGIENIMALRGDRPHDMPEGAVGEYRYASELIGEIKAAGDFCIGGACYPEGHPESASFYDDIEHLKAKVDAGCDYLVTQMFFDNNIMYNFLYRLRRAGITVPVVAGIMPVLNAKQIMRSAKLSGTALPRRFLTIVDRFGDDAGAMAQAGIAFATEQMIDLIANGVENIHLYTMNKPSTADAIQRNLSCIVPSAGRAVAERDGVKA